MFIGLIIEIINIISWILNKYVNANTIVFVCIKN